MAFRIKKKYCLSFQLRREKQYRNINIIITQHNSALQGKKVKTSLMCVVSVQGQRIPKPPIKQTI